MWHVGERDGHAISGRPSGRGRTSLRAGRSQRAIAGELGSDAVAVSTCLAGGDGFRDARWRVRRMRVQGSQRGHRTSSASAHISDVIDKGVQPVYRMTLADGKEITLTENHRVLTDDGWLHDARARSVSSAMARPPP